MTRVYLAGSIEGITLEQAGGWRRYVTEALLPHKIYTYDPFAMAIQPLSKDSVEESWKRNMRAIEKSHLVLCCTSLAARNLGSFREIQKAVDLALPVYLVDVDIFRTQNISAWDLVVFESLTKALDTIISLWGS